MGRLSAPVSLLSHASLFWSCRLKAHLTSELGSYSSFYPSGGPKPSAASAWLCKKRSSSICVTCSLSHQTETALRHRERWACSICPAVTMSRTHLCVCIHLTKWTRQILIVKPHSNSSLAFSNFRNKLTPLFHIQSKRVFLQRDQGSKVGDIQCGWIAFVANMDVSKHS